MSTSKSLTFGCAVALCALAAVTQTAPADVIAPATVREFGVFKDSNDNGVWDPAASPAAAGDQKIGCVKNMIQWLSAGTSYGYKQYDNVKGADISAWPNSSDGATPMNPGAHATWLEPEPQTLQFWFGWSRKDHDTSSTDFLAAPRGFNMGIIMNQEKKHWDSATQTMVHDVVPLATPVYNNVKLDIAVKGSSLTPLLGEPTDPQNIKPRVDLSDEHTTDPNLYYDPPWYKEMPRPPAPTDAVPYPILVGQELQPNPLPPAGWDYAFDGNWGYRQFSTDGGVLSNLRPKKGEFVMAVKLEQLVTGGGVTDPLDPDYKGIKKIVIYDFSKPKGTYDTSLASTYDGSGYTRLELTVGVDIFEGDTIFFTDCCEVVEPVTLALLGVGGAAVSGFGWLRRRKAKAEQ